MPEAILLTDVEQLGERGAVIDVSKGYLRNYLIPRKLAAPATPAALAAARRRIEAAEQAARDAERRARERVERAGEYAQLLSKTVLTISERAGDDGRLYGSVQPQDIADAIKEARGLHIDKTNVHLEEPIRNLGTYMIVVNVTDELQATVKTIVTAQQ
jgi:large subunit ribosomal protein L9